METWQVQELRALRCAQGVLQQLFALIFRHVLCLGFVSICRLLKAAYAPILLPGGLVHEGLVSSWIWFPGGQASVQC